MAARPPAFRLAPRRLVIPLVVLAVGTIATVVTAVYSSRAARAQDQIRFDGVVDRMVESITSRVDTYIALLRAGAGLFASTDDVSGMEFQLFVERLDLRRRYPGIQGIGFARHVPASEKEALIARMQASGRPGFHVWPDFPRPDYFPIVYLEPQDRRNQAAIGYDMFTDAVRRAAMVEAVRAGAARASGKVTLVQEIDDKKQPGFLIYAPVYPNERPVPAGVDERFAVLLGFIYGPFRAGDFLSAVFEQESQTPVDVAVYDGTRTDPQSLLFDWGRAAAAGGFGRFETARQVQVLGSPWTVVVRSLRPFEGSGEGRLVSWILAIGLLVTLALAVATRVEARAREAAESAAARLRQSEEALRASEAKLRQLVEAERQAHAEAGAANRAKDDFLATLSHELRTPLNAIVGWSSMLRAGRLNEAQRVRALEVIERSARTQADLIEDLLDVSRIITGKMAIELRPLRFNAPIRAALDAVGPTAEAKGVRLLRRLEADAPVLGDPDRLQQVAWNLLSNAIKFTPEGGTVTAAVQRVDGQIELRVSDTGSGIDPSFLPHVFERFRQHDSSTTRAHGGMGLGLAIVRHLVEAHGGEVQAESPGAGRGATFVVRVPIQTHTPDRGGRHGRALPPAGEEATDLSGLRTLVVDDDADSRELLAEALTARGALVVTADSAAEALSLLGREPVDILLADIGMPGTDGYDLVRAVRRHESEAVRTMPAVAVTAFARQDDRRRAEEAGFQEHFVKPVDVEALQAAVRRLAAPAR